MGTMTLPRILPGLDAYQLVQLLGEGGMGKAILAKHKKTGQTVVILPKTPRLSLTGPNNFPILQDRQSAQSIQFVHVA